MPDAFLPPDLAALAEPPPPALQPVALRLDPVTIARLEALRDRLNRPTRASLLRHLVGEGLRSAEAQLGGQEAGAGWMEHLTTVAAGVIWGLRPLLTADGPLAVLQIRPGAPAGFAWLELLTPHLVCRLELLADFRRAGGDRSETLRIEAAPDGQVALCAISEPPGMPPRRVRLMAPEPAPLPPVGEHLRPIPGPWHCPEPGRMVPPLLMDPALLIRALKALEAAAGRPVELQLLEGSGPIRLALLPSVNCDEIGGGSLQLCGMGERPD